MFNRNRLNIQKLIGLKVFELPLDKANPAPHIWTNRS